MKRRIASLLCLWLSCGATLGEDGVRFVPQISRIRTFAEADDPQLFEAYRERRFERWTVAIETRRYMNMGKVHHYRTAVVIPVDPIGVSAIQRGWVWQPPIYGRRSWLDALFELEMARIRAGTTR